jgi:hypothetical protein
MPGVPTHIKDKSPDRIKRHYHKVTKFIQNLKKRSYQHLDTCKLCKDTGGTDCSRPFFFMQNQARWEAYLRRFRIKVMLPLCGKDILKLEGLY